MAQSDKKFQYKVAQVLHWVAALFIGFNLASGWRIGDFPLDQKQLLMMVHTGVGTIICFMMLFRWWWRKTNKLYVPHGWWKRPAVVLQWVFYPLVLTQVAIGLAQAAFVDYDIMAFGFIPYSALATADAGLQALFLQWHDLMAWFLIFLVACHGIERLRLLYID